MKGYTPIEQITTEVFDSACTKSVTVNGKVQEDYKAIWNTSKDHLTTIASKQYNLVQHKDVFESVTDALKNLNLKTSIRLQQTGDRLSADVVFEGREINCGRGEIFGAGFRLINSYNKTTGVIIQPFLVRLACLNGATMQDVIKAGFSVHHSNKMCIDFEKHIPLLLETMVNSNEKLKAIINEALGDSIEWELLDKILNNVKVCEKHKENIYAILKRDHTDLSKITRWDLYNAFTNYATHGQQIKPSAEAGLQRRAQKLLLSNFEEVLAIVPEAK